MSLLSPQMVPTRSATTPAWADDLGLDELIAAFGVHRRHRAAVRGIFSSLVTDEPTLRWRQDVLEDFLSFPQLTDGIEALLPTLASLGQDTALLGRRTRSALLETSDRLSELDLYTELVGQLHALLAAHDVQSQALQTLERELGAVIQRPTYGHLREELPRLREPLQSVGSITVGINLDFNLKPISAVLLAIHGRDVGGQQSLLSRLLSADDDDERERRGLAAPHRFAKDAEQRRYNELFQDVDQLLKQTAKPVAQALRRYVKTSSKTLVLLEPELVFFVAAARMITRLQERGIPFCKPDVLPASARTTRITGLHNLRLALCDEKPTVPSDVVFDETGRIGVLTGPNSGGKTTYLRSVGLAQVVFQAGLFVPAQEANISPVTNILTHFPRLETRQQGRLEEEAERLRDLFAKVDDGSLVLLNETFSSTAFGEALYLAQDVLSALCALGARAVFATHLVELVDQFDEIESVVERKSRLCSLVAGIATNADGLPQPKYQIQRGAPLGRSFAREIARKHGISLDQILSNRANQDKDTLLS